MYNNQFCESRKNGKIQNQERTAYRQCRGHLNFDYYLQVWPNRPSMAKSIRMQGKRQQTNFDWIPVVPLKDNEGYNRH